MTPARFPHSDTPRSTLGCQLPRAYRRLPRPSSALDAKASTMCPYQLATQTPQPTPHHLRVGVGCWCVHSSANQTHYLQNYATSHSGLGVGRCSRPLSTSQTNKHPARGPNPPAGRWCLRHPTVCRPQLLPAAGSEEGWPSTKQLSSLTAQGSSGRRTHGGG